MDFIQRMMTESSSRISNEYVGDDELRQSVLKIFNMQFACIHTQSLICMLSRRMLTVLFESLLACAINWPTFQE